MKIESHPEILDVDVVIVGGGISGMILSWLLNAGGVNHRVVDRKDSFKSNRVETIPPSVLPWVEKVGLLDIFLRNGSKVHGYQSLWKGELVDQKFSESHANQYGLKLNKAGLLRDLSNQLSGHCLYADNSPELAHGKELSTVKLKQDGRALTLKTPMIVDATGRKRAVSKSFGIKEFVYGENLAFNCILPKVGATLKYGFFTEDLGDAWGTLTHLDEQWNMMTLYTQEANHKQFKRYNHWKDLLKGSQILYRHLAVGDFQVHGQLANSSMVDVIANDRYVAVGDAAMAFDPISSHGISNAIYCAYEVAKALTSSDSNAVLTYGINMHNVFRQYLQQVQRLYAHRMN